MIGPLGAALLLGAGGAALAGRLPLAPAVAGLHRAAGRAMRVPRRRAADRWKERALLLCARATLAATLRLVLNIAAICLSLALAARALDAVVPGLWAGLFSAPVLAGLTAGSLAWLLARRRVHARLHPA